MKVTTDRLATLRIDIRMTTAASTSSCATAPDRPRRRPKDQHLLLMARAGIDRGGRNVKSKYLCEFDERHWFVAAVPARDIGRTASKVRILTR